MSQSQIPSRAWTTLKIPYHEMPSVERRLLAGESRRSIAKDYNCSGRLVSKLIVQYLHLEGKPIVPGITRKIRAERGRVSRATFKEWTKERDAHEKAVVAEGRLQHAHREAALALPRDQRLVKETPEQRDLRRRTAGYLKGAF